MFQQKIFAVFFLALSLVAHAATDEQPGLAKVQSDLRGFRAEHSEMPVLDYSAVQKAAADGAKSVYLGLTKFYGTDEQLRLALKEVSETAQAPGKVSVKLNKSRQLLAVNFVRLSRAPVQAPKKGEPTPVEYSKEDLKKMQQAYEELSSSTQKIQAYAEHLSSAQIREITRDNPHPNMPTLAATALGKAKVCNEAMVEKISADIGRQHFQRLGLMLMLTGSSYEALYEMSYLKHAAELLQKDSSEEAKLVLLEMLPVFTSDKIEKRYSTSLHQIGHGEDDFLRLFGPEVSKQDARTFFQGYARKYPPCLGLLSTEYLRYKNKFR